MDNQLNNVLGVLQQLAQTVQQSVEQQQLSDANQIGFTAALTRRIDTMALTMTNHVIDLKSVNRAVTSKPPLISNQNLSIKNFIASDFGKWRIMEGLDNEEDTCKRFLSLCFPAPKSSVVQEIMNSNKTFAQKMEDIQSRVLAISPAQIKKRFYALNQQKSESYLGYFERVARLAPNAFEDENVATEEVRNKFKASFDRNRSETSALYTMVHDPTYGTLSFAEITIKILEICNFYGSQVKIDSMNKIPEDLMDESDHVQNAEQNAEQNPESQADNACLL